MTDIFDRAQDLDATMREAAIAEQRARVGHGPALTHCEDCGDEIPAARRAAVAGCRTCIHCQALREREAGGLRRE
ncbi:TraR/DksA family transcriptional regulator [Thauera sp. 2A1]|uniref:TraR/DksA family transcriptional regulator n=1 Tax=Thauera sp. 2A1 TaxID=2570191 RepID=UPI001290DB17|nr:TraR/DksA family transcriptional regulator [Thauera sp. 2A1]KAI5914586.1 TraR/DksA family transcriptional regulator [Thauera sp. 2A1]